MRKVTKTLQPPTAASAAPQILELIVSPIRQRVDPAVSLHLLSVSLVRNAGDGGLLVCRLDNSALATEKESRLLLYPDMDLDLDNLSCNERLSKAQLTSKDKPRRWWNISRVVF